MESRRCTCCGHAFRPRAQSPQQRFCSASACQRERRRRWQQAKRASDPDYRDNQARAQRAWATSHRDYWAEYRRRNPAYRDRNRDAARQRQRERRHARRFAKMDASRREEAVPSGTYRLVPATSAAFAKMDAWTVEIMVLSRASTAPLEVCKERTR
jgi:hypothetical protein